MYFVFLAWNFRVGVKPVKEVLRQFLIIYILTCCCHCLLPSLCQEPQPIITFILSAHTGKCRDELFSFHEVCIALLAIESTIVLPLLTKFTKKV